MSEGGRTTLPHQTFVTSVTASLIELTSPRVTGMGARLHTPVSHTKSQPRTVDTPQRRNTHRLGVRAACLACMRLSKSVFPNLCLTEPWPVGLLTLTWPGQPCSELGSATTGGHHSVKRSLVHVSTWEIFQFPGMTHALRPAHRYGPDEQCGAGATPLHTALRRGEGGRWPTYTTRRAAPSPRTPRAAPAPPLATLRYGRGEGGPPCVSADA